MYCASYHFKITYLDLLIYQNSYPIKCICFLSKYKIFHFKQFSHNFFYLFSIAPFDLIKMFVFQLYLKETLQNRFKSKHFFKEPLKVQRKIRYSLFNSTRWNQLKMFLQSYLYATKIYRWKFDESRGKRVFSVCSWEKMRIEFKENWLSFHVGLFILNLG